MFINYKKHVLCSVSVLTILCAAQTQAFAQESAPTDDDDGQFLGTLTLGESKREVQTDTPTAVTTIDKEEIDDRQASTIAELIDSVPGVTLVNGSTPSGSGINIRGFGANGTFGTDQKVAVFVDGASSGSEEIYRVGTQLFTDPFLYRSVTVQRGTVGSYEYGSGIVGGIVLLETIDASDLTGGEPGFALGVTAGGYTNSDGLNGSVTAAWQSEGNLELLANYSYREQENQEDGNGDEIGNSAFELPSYLIKARYSFGSSLDHAVEASFNHTETAERDVPYDTFFTTTDAFGNVDRDIVNETASLSYTYTPANSDLIAFEALLTYANQEIDQEYVPFSSPAGGEFGFGVVSADLQYETTKLTIKNSSFIETGSIGHELRYGFEWRQSDRLEANSAPGGTDERYAIFLINDMSLTDNLSLIPALRFESQELEGDFYDASVDARVRDTRENDALMGGISVRYGFDSGFALFGSYAYTESFPILDDIPTSAFSNTFNIETPELSTTYEAGLSYDGLSVFAEDDVLALKLNYYSTFLDDVTSYFNADEIDLEGLELEASYALQSGFYTDLNANFTTGEETQEPQVGGAVIDWDRTPQDTIRASLGQRFGRTTDISAEVVTAFDRSLDVGATEPLEGDAYTVLNLRATLSPQSGFLQGTTFRFGLENAFNEDYTPLLATRPAPGRNFKFTLSRLF